MPEKENTPKDKIILYYPLPNEANIEMDSNHKQELVCPQCKTRQTITSSFQFHTICLCTSCNSLLKISGIKLI
jgi:hypothetical protein